MNICQTLMEHDTTSDIKTLEKDDINSILIYLCFSKEIYDYLPHIRWNKLS